MRPFRDKQIYRKRQIVLAQMRLFPVKSIWRIRHTFKVLYSNWKVALKESKKMTLFCGWTIILETLSFSLS